MEECERDERERKGERGRKGGMKGGGEGREGEEERERGGGRQRERNNKALLACFFSTCSSQTARHPASLRSGSRHWTHDVPSYLLDPCQR